MRDLRLAVAAAMVLWALGACGSCGATASPASSTGPTQAELASARIGGAWRLTVTIDTYTGAQPPSTIVLKAGHQGVDTVTFVSTCPSPGVCTLQMWGSSGPDPSQASYYRFYSNSTGLEGPPVSTPMTESGATYTAVIPISGFGGFTCPPSRTVPRPDQRLSLTVTGASSASSGWTATRLTGTETLIAGWGCANGAFTNWTIEHLTVTGRAGQQS
jgi:hypothetical protein